MDEGRVFDRKRAITKIRWRSFPFNLSQAELSLAAEVFQSSGRDHDQYETTLLCYYRNVEFFH
jgi:hypothetical protein